MQNRSQSGLKAERAFGEEHDHRRAEQEAAHFLAFLSDRLLIRRSAIRASSPLRGGLTTPCQTVAMLPTMVAPTSTSTKGPNSDSKHADHAFVAGEQAGHAARGGRVDREQRAGHIDHAHQRPSQGMWMRW
jgi:hypothetical protein